MELCFISLFIKDKNKIVHATNLLDIGNINCINNFKKCEYLADT